MLNRRSLLGAILAAGVAPAAIGSGILMPVRQIIMPPELSVADIRRITRQMHARWMGTVWEQAFDRAYYEHVAGGFAAIKILHTEEEVQAVLVRDVANGYGIITIDALHI